MNENWKPEASKFSDRSSQDRERKGLSDLKETIKETPISHILGRYLEIKKSGSNLVALCPFHADGHPSLSVSDKINFFKCFACNTSGDAITFVELYKKVPFIEALKEIAELLGLDFNEYNSEKEKDPKTQMALRVLKKSGQIYQKLAKEILKGPFQDFIQKRGLSPEIAEMFELGISPHGNLISDYLNSIADSKDKKFALDIATEIHLIRKSTRPGLQSTYDSFHERIMFPIWNGQGAIIGYTSRAIRDDQKPKYLNSSESFIFSKGNILYGLHLARASIREKNAVIVCEGNMDLIALHQYAFKHSVAIMGAAMSVRAIKTLKTLTTNFYLALDSDDAGKRAMRGLLPIFLEEDINPKMIDFSPHKDPDEYLQKEGALALQKLIDEAPYFLDQVLNSLVPSDKSQLTSENKIALLHKVFEALTPLKDKLLASEKMISFAEKIDLKSDPQILSQQFMEFLKSKNKKQFQLKPIIKSKKNVEENREAGPKLASTNEIILSRTEQEILKIALSMPHALTHQLFPELLDFVTHDEVKIYLGKLRDLAQMDNQNNWENVVLDSAKEMGLSMVYQQTVSSLLWNLKSQSGGFDQNIKPEEDFILRYFSDIKKCHKEDQLKMARKNLLNKQKETEDTQASGNLLLQIQEIDKELRNLKQLKN